MKIKKGNIVLASCNEVTRLIYITKVKVDYFSGYLLSNIVELAGSKDAILETDMTGLPYKLIAQTNIEILMTESQIEKVMTKGRQLDFKKLDYGVTVNARDDMRAFKDSESYDAMLLGLEFHLSQFE